MRMRRLALLAVLGLLAAGASSSVGPAFGGFVGSAQSTVNLSVDTLDQHVTVSVPANGGRVTLSNPTGTAQALQLAVVDPADGSVSAHFDSTGNDRASIAPGGSDTIDLLDSASQPTGGEVAVGVVRPEGSPFPSHAYTVPAP
jgi:hypothetical protein